MGAPDRLRRLRKASRAGGGLTTKRPEVDHRRDVWLCGADDGTRTRTLTEKQIFVPPRLSPPSDDVRGLDCPFAIARRL